MTAPALQRQTFSVSRAADFLDKRALVSQTGQPSERFGDVVLKELLDNALDACETASVQPEISITMRAGEDARRVTVADNGPGIPPDVMARVLDFTTLTSDKALYRSPSRGAQGNALKTIAGIPHALGVAAPVIIEAGGVRHVVAVSLDPAGNLKVRHDREDIPRAPGTTVTVPLPVGISLDAGAWARGYALVNPHATFVLSEHPDSAEPDDSEIYKATAQDGWRKPVPTDPTSPWWYDVPAFTRLACSLAALGDTRPIGAFVAEFRGLSSSAKRREIAAAVPGVRRVADLADDPSAAAALLAAMQQASTEPKPGILGQVPADHYRLLLDRLYGTERFWHAHGGIVADGVPWHIEAAAAVTRRPGVAVFACNYGVSFGDPLGSAELRTSDVSAFGARSFLSHCDAKPGPFNGERRAAVVHVTCAAPGFTDKGKTHLDVPEDVAAEAAKVLWRAARELYREQQSAERAYRRAERDERRERRAEQARETDREPTLIEAVSAVIPEAVRQQRGGTDLPYSARSLFYKVRPLAQRITSRPLTDSYFTQTLLPAYQREHGALDGLYYEPRGELHHPHDRQEERTVPLGTREVSAYTPPSWTYDKILVVEKAGLWPVLRDSRIADRFDMAVITSEGFAVEACRSLLASLSSRDVTIFALHDADPSGYNIARTLGEETRRMPGHHADVIDLGLTAGDAVRLGMEPETFLRSAALPERIVPSLTDLEAEWFTGRPAGWDHYGRARRWQCKRVELNAFSSPGLIAYIEDGLRRHGADGKVVPPAGVIEWDARSAHREQVTEAVERAIAELVDTDAIVAALVSETAPLVDFAITPERIRERLDRERSLAWRNAVNSEIARRMTAADVDIRQRVTELLAQRPASPKE